MQVHTRGVELLAACEHYRAGFLGQPVSAVTSAAFVVASAGILVTRPRSTIACAERARHQQTVFALLVAGIGVGSFIQHGPHPDWQVYAHDLPLAGVLAFAAADAASDLIGRELSPTWWLVPSAAMVPIVAAGSRASTIAQAILAIAAIGLNVLRARRRPVLRKPVTMALLAAAVGAVTSSVMDRPALCRPESVVQGHGVWHVLASAALWLLARGYLAGPKEMLRLLRQSCAAFSTSRAVRVL